MRFRNPAVLFALIPLALIVLKAYWEMASPRRRYAPRVLVPWRNLWRLGRGMPIPPRFWHVLGYSTACALFVLAAARPQTSYSKVHRNVEGIDIMVVLDISASMRIEDFRNMNRFDTAKQIIKEFVLGRQSDKIGLEIFSGEAVTLVPPTLDYALVTQALDSTEIGDLKDGTAIGDALATAVARLKESRAKSRILILVTDGDSNVGQVDPLTAGDLAKGYGIKVYSVAIGRDGRVAMPFVQKDVFGKTFKTYQWFDSSINPELLRQISNATNGKFYRVQDDVNAFRAVFADIDRLERTKIETTEQVKYDEKFMLYLQFALLIFAMTFVLQHTLLRVYP